MNPPSDWPRTPTYFHASHDLDALAVELITADDAGNRGGWSLSHGSYTPGRVGPGRDRTAALRLCRPSVHPVTGPRLQCPACSGWWQVRSMADGGAPSPTELAGVIRCACS